jgi:hypothetical protein
MKKAVVTICCGPFFERLAAITHATIQAYADKLGADFIVWREYGRHSLPHYQKLEIGELLDRYDRVLYLDTDVLVRDDTPDLFALVPEDKLGMLVEGDYVAREHITIQYMLAMRFDAGQWDGKYYNSGVMVLSRQHRDLFAQPEVETDHFKEQTHLNLMIARTRTAVFPLPYRFNRMYFMDWFYGEERCDAYIIHYGGLNVVACEDEVLRQAAEDRDTWARTRPHYRFPRHVIFNVQGDLGDQAAAEPTIRYAREVLYPQDDLLIVSEYPHLFAHLELPVYSAPDRAPPNMARYLACGNLHNPMRPPLAIKTSCVDRILLASLNMLGIELPLAYRRPRLSVDPAALASVRRKVEPHRPGALVLLHPGPVAGDPAGVALAWQLYSQVLADHGIVPAVIGSRQRRELAVVPFDTSRCLNLVDRLSADEVVALVSEAPVLLASDSAAVAVAGAFDHWIGLVPPGTDPQYILPWRHGTQSFRAAYLGDASGCEPIAAQAFHDELSRRAGPRPAAAGPALPDPPVVLKFVEDALRAG